MNVSNVMPLFNDIFYHFLIYRRCVAYLFDHVVILPTLLSLGGERAYVNSCMKHLSLAWLTAHPQDLWDISQPAPPNLHRKTLPGFLRPIPTSVELKKQNKHYSPEKWASSPIGTIPNYSVLCPRPPTGIFVEHIRTGTPSFQVKSCLNGLFRL